MVRKKRVTMADVAKLAGVSRTTVSFILNNVPDTNIPDATRQRVLQIARELNYMPNVQALNLATGKTMMIALVVRQTSEQMSGDAFAGEFIRGVTGVIEAENYHLVIHAAEPDARESTYGKLVRTHKVDGLLISSPLVNDQEVRLLYREETPIVLHGATDTQDIPSVDVDNRQGAYMAVRYLIDLGHRRIGHISNAPFSYASSSDRLDGYCQALAEAGIPYDESLVLAGEFTASSGYEPMRALLDLPNPPTAVFVGSDMVALGAMEAIRSRGARIPEDISLVGFDDILYARYTMPPLTTVRIPAYELGRSAGDLMLKIIRGESLPGTRILLPTELVVRRSTIKCPA
ncbi:MAG: LacI family transcriptional regulator [Chloroflexi bacterium]|nr:LacI family transcriptional regulator [Chloroflexota bacterium]MDL1884441.1 LacI family transcriptional regulator [Anaerolineae bacterium CFX8]